MSRMSSKIIRTAALAVVLAVAATSSAGAAQDLRSPDAQDAARGSEISRTQDLRSPDAQDAARGTEIPRTQDLRSPDAQAPVLRSHTAHEAGRGPETPQSPGPSPDSTGFGWGNAALVSGGAIGLVLIGLGGVAIFRRRNDAVRKPRASVVSS